MFWPSRRFGREPVQREALLSPECRAILADFLFWNPTHSMGVPPQVPQASMPYSAGEVILSAVAAARQAVSPSCQAALWGTSGSLTVGAWFLNPVPIELRSEFQEGTP
jgi:hypothetical protein